ncbi:MAG TPA: glycosyltransferase family 2 protein [Solirubrobacteraceae bacterium]
MLLLSVVTPTFNPGPYLAHTLDSVSRLVTKHEHLVIDGGSTDGTVELLRHHDDDALTWISEPDRGQTDAVNKGLSRARGDLVIWINGDDEVAPDGIDAAVAYLAAEPECQAVYGGLDFTDAEGAVQRSYLPGPWSFRRYLFLGDYVPTPTIVFRRARAQAVGALDEQWVDAADYDFYLRLMHGVRVDRLERTHVRFRYHADSKSARNVWKQQDEALEIRLRWARNARDRAVMLGFDRLKRAVLPPLTRGRWPAPY